MLGYVTFCNNEGTHETLITYSFGNGRFYEENFVILRTQWLLILLKYNADVLVEHN